MDQEIQLIAKWPLVSILMPAYNCDRYIGPAIEAVLHQTFKDFEFIIINDGSTDNTKQIIQTYKDSRIKFYENDMNAGIVKTLNKGLETAKGKYILRTDADDIAMENMASLLVDFMETHPDYVACGANMKLIGSEKIISYPSDNAALKVYTLSNCPFSHSTVIFKKSVLDENNLRYNDFFKDAEDYGLWSQLILHGKFHNLPVATLHYRESSTQVTARPGYEKNRLDSLSKIYSFHAAAYFNLKEGDINIYTKLIYGGKADSLPELKKAGNMIIGILNKKQTLFENNKLKNFLFIKWHWFSLNSYHLGKSVFTIYLKNIIRTKNLLRVKSISNHFFKMVTAR